MRNLLLKLNQDGFINLCIKSGWCGRNAYIMHNHVGVVQKWKAAGAVWCQFGQRWSLQLSSSKKKQNRCMIQREEVGRGSTEDKMHIEKKTMEV